LKPLLKSTYWWGHASVPVYRLIATHSCHFHLQHNTTNSGPDLQITMNRRHLLALMACCASPSCATFASGDLGKRVVDFQTVEGLHDYR
jgi:hypothetical protein